MCAGAFQSTGWPSVISVIANWSGKGKRGLTMGLWSTSIPLGNILGTVVASSLLALVSRMTPCPLLALWQPYGTAW